MLLLRSMWIYKFHCCFRPMTLATATRSSVPRTPWMKWNIIVFPTNSIDQALLSTGMGFTLWTILWPISIWAWATTISTLETTTIWIRRMNWYIFWYIYSYHKTFPAVSQWFCRPSIFPGPHVWGRPFGRVGRSGIDCAGGWRSGGNGCSRCCPRYFIYSSGWMSKN